MTVRRYHEGKAIILENETYVTNEQGILVRRVEMVLEDGTEHIQDTPVDGHSAAQYRPPASAPTEDEVNIPIVHATTVPAGYDPPSPSSTTFQASTGSVAVVTGPPEPPRVAVVTGPPRPPAPPQVYYTPSSRYIYRDQRTGACVICGLSIVACFLICCCCFLPVVIIPIIWASGAWNGEYDDAVWNDDHY